jgi:hypothetical protein
LHNEELHNLYSSTIIIIRITKSSRIRRVGHATHMGRKEMHTKFSFGKPEGKRASEDIIIDGKIILNRS